jgi:hypothetical protein
MLDRTAAGAFIDGYRRTFESFDVDAIAACFAFPMQVASEGDAVTVVVVPDLDAWRPQIARIVGAYRLLGVHGARLASLDIDEVTPHVAHAVVHWALAAADGSPIYEFTASYTLVDAGAGPRIVAIAHDETPKLQAAVARARGA